MSEKMKEYIRAVPLTPDFENRCRAGNQVGQYCNFDSRGVQYSYNTYIELNNIFFVPDLGSEHYRYPDLGSEQYRYFEDAFFFSGAPQSLNYIIDNCKKRFNEVFDEDINAMDDFDFSCFKAVTYHEFERYSEEWLLLSFFGLWFNLRFACTRDATLLTIGCLWQALQSKRYNEKTLREGQCHSEGRKRGQKKATSSNKNRGKKNRKAIITEAKRLVNEEGVRWRPLTKLANRIDTDARADISAGRKTKIAREKGVPFSVSYIRTILTDYCKAHDL